MRIFLADESFISINVNEAIKAPVDTTLEETGLDLTAASGCMIWIDSTTDEISATTYRNGEMIPVRISATDAEKTTLKSFADSLYL